MVPGRGLPSFSCMYSAVPGLFAEMTILFPWNCFDTFAKNQFATDVRVYFRTPNSKTLSILMPEPHCLGYCSFVSSFEIEKCTSTNFSTFFFFKIVLTMKYKYNKPYMQAISYCSWEKISLFQL